MLLPELQLTGQRRATADSISTMEPLARPQQPRCSRVSYLHFQACKRDILVNVKQLFKYVNVNTGNNNYLDSKTGIYHFFLITAITKVSTYIFLLSLTRVDF